MVLRILKALDNKHEANVIRLEEAMKRACESASDLECVSIDLSVSLVQHRSGQEELKEVADKHLVNDERKTK
jgi:hypothetical protein